MKDVARIAGVSITTVSRVINNSRLVEEETRKRVLDVMSAHHYIPNKLARGLVRQRSKTIALILPDISNPFFADIIHGVEDVSTPFGYSMFLCNSNFNHDKESSYLQEMAERQAEGAIIVSAFLQNVPQILRLNQSSMRIVGIQTQIEGIDRVNTRDYEGMKQAVTHLVKLGHRKIGFLCIDLRGCRARYKAYCDVLALNHIKANPAYVRENTKGIYTENPGYYMMKELLTLPDPPTAVQTLNDHLAFGAYQAIKEAGLRIPEDISIIGYDDIPLSSLIEPPLTTVHQPAYDMGKAGCELLMQRINSAASAESSRELLFDTHLVKRSSETKLQK